MLQMTAGKMELSRRTSHSQQQAQYRECQGCLSVTLGAVEELHAGTIQVRGRVAAAAELSPGEGFLPIRSLSSLLSSN